LDLALSLWLSFCTLPLGDQLLVQIKRLLAGRWVGPRKKTAFLLKSTFSTCFILLLLPAVDAVI